MRRAAVLMLGLALWIGRAGAADPPYPHGDFHGECATCHTSDRWSPAKVGPSFKHKDAFPLRGAHKTAPCRSCHLTLDFADTPTACADCHSDVHLGELGSDCARCHTPVNFLDRSQQQRDHRTTRFPLLGAHATQDCESCHKPQPQGTLTWVGLATECEACHLPLYQATTDPNHAAAGFPTDCALCHTPTVWARARFDHAGTAFPLTGAHTTVACASCHAGGYAGTPTACVACHQADYNGTTDPNHAAAAFPTNCTACHNTRAWSPAQFDHAATGFPLTGAHTSVPCAGCHAGGYSGTPTACVACHQADYNATTDPNHVTAGFPTTCTLCHTTVTWTGGSFTQHDTLYFPIYSGSHRGRWDRCTDCHTQPSNYATFSCFLCHSQSETNSNHNGVSGYAYDSNLCYQCHPQGRH